MTPDSLARGRYLAEQLQSHYDRNAELKASVGDGRELAELYLKLAEVHREEASRTAHWRSLANSAAIEADHLRRAVTGREAPPTEVEITGAGDVFWVYLYRGTHLNLITDPDTVRTEAEGVTSGVVPGGWWWTLPRPPKKTVAPTPEAAPPISEDEEDSYRSPYVPQATLRRAAFELMISSGSSRYTHKALEAAAEFFVGEEPDAKTVVEMTTHFIETVRVCARSEERGPEEFEAAILMAFLWTRARPAVRPLLKELALAPHAGLAWLVGEAKCLLKEEEGVDGVQDAVGPTDVG